MKGTEKQIAWAEEIKTATLEAIDRLIADGQQYAGNPKADALLAKLSSQRDAINACEYAADIIDCFASVKPYKPVEDRCKAFIAASRVHLPQNKAQEKLLGK